MTGSHQTAAQWANTLGMTLAANQNQAKIEMSSPQGRINFDGVLPRADCFGRLVLLVERHPQVRPCFCIVRLEIKALPPFFFGCCPLAVSLVVLRESIMLAGFFSTFVSDFGLCLNRRNGDNGID